MTVYKPITQLTTEAANIAIELGNDKAPAGNGKLNNGLKEVLSRLLTPIQVNKENIESTLVKDGFHKQSEL
nr:D-xylose-binding periplasmic protein precursor [Candidatus Pantoea persica]